MFAPPLFKDIPKMGAVDSPFYRTGLGMPTYPGYTPSLLHPGLGGPTPFVPPSHLPSFAPKVSEVKKINKAEINILFVCFACFILI